MQVYANTKLGNIVFSNELNRRLARTNIKSVAVHPVNYYLFYFIYFVYFIYVLLLFLLILGNCYN